MSNPKNTKIVTQIVPANQQRMRVVSAMADKRAAAAAFTDYRGRKSANTLARQDADLDAWSVFLERLGVARTREALATQAEAWRGITHGMLTAFVGQQLGLGFAVRSVNARLSTIRTYCQLATRAGVIDPGELTLIRTVRGYSRLEGKRMDTQRKTTRVGTKKIEGNVLSESQVATLLQHDGTPSALRDATMIVLMADHGLRVGELVGITTNGIAFGASAATMTFYREKVDKTQTHQLTPRAAAIVRAYLALVPRPLPGPLVRRTVRGGALGKTAITRFGVFRLMQERGRAAGIDNLSPHDLRHTWATNAARSGTPIDRLTDAGGWSSSATPLNRYVKPASIANMGVLLDGE